jgi:hypothetical protein
LEVDFASGDRHNLTFLFGLEQSTVGLMRALLLITVVTLLATVPGIFGEELGLTVVAMPPMPSSELLQGIASLGGALVIAYVVQAVWMVQEAKPADDREDWVGFVTGTGVAGLIGVVLVLVLAAHRAAGHENLLDRFGCIWAGTALCALAGVVMFQPPLVHRLRKTQEEEKEEGS